MEGFPIDVKDDENAQRMHVLSPKLRTLSLTVHLALSFSLFRFGKHDGPL
jgi:hypothetical protein